MEAPARRPAAVAVGARALHGGLDPRQALVEGLGREVAGGPARPDERQLQRQARIGALAHVVEHAAEEVDQPVDGRRLEPLGLACHAGPLVVGDGRFGRQLPELLLEEDQPKVGEEVGDERPEVGPGVGLRVDGDAGSRRRPRRRRGP